MSRLTAEFDDVIKGLVVLAFVLGPVLKKLVAGLNDPARRKAAPRSPVQSSASPPRRASVTWEELMRGAVPDTPEMPEAEVESAQASMGDRTEPSRNPSATDTLDGIPEEGQLERLGARDPLAPEPGGLGAIGAVGAPTQAREFEETASHDWGTETEITRARVLRKRMHRTGWRDGVLLGELLGPPLALREDWSHPGPPLGNRQGAQHG